MKKNTKVGMILFFIATISFMGCNKEPEEEKKYGYVYFFTQAHLPINCGSFGVNVYVEGERVGVLYYSYYVANDSALCDKDFNTAKVLKCQYEVGEYNYSADFTCGFDNNFSTNGTFVIEEDACIAVGVFTRN